MPRQVLATPKLAAPPIVRALLKAVIELNMIKIAQLLYNT
jgi:hypothetical protein